MYFQFCFMLLSVWGLVSGITFCKNKPGQSTFIVSAAPRHLPYSFWQCWWHLIVHPLYYHSMHCIQSMYSLKKEKKLCLVFLAIWLPSGQLIMKGSCGPVVQGLHSWWPSTTNTSQFWVRELWRSGLNSYHTGITLSRGFKNDCRAIWLQGCAKCSREQ